MIFADSVPAIASLMVCAESSQLQPSISACDAPQRSRLAGFAMVANLMREHRMRERMARR
jgi:hypothetical protein